MVPVLLPLQILNAFDGVALTDGKAWMVNVMSNGTPEQLPATPSGVMLNLTTASLDELALLADTEIADGL